MGYYIKLFSETPRYIFWANMKTQHLPGRKHAEWLEHFITAAIDAGVSCVIDQWYASAGPDSEKFQFAVRVRGAPDKHAPSPGPSGRARRT